MGPLTGLLTLPASGPLAMLTWVARQIANLADQEMLNPERIELALVALERRLDAGEIDEATFEAEEATLLRELERIHLLRQAGGPAELAAGPADWAGQPRDAEPAARAVSTGDPPAAAASNGAGRHLETGVAS